MGEENKSLSKIEIAEKVFHIVSGLAWIVYIIIHRIRVDTSPSEPR